MAGPLLAAAARAGFVTSTSVFGCVACRRGLVLSAYALSPLALSLLALSYSPKAIEFFEDFGSAEQIVIVYCLYMLMISRRNENHRLDYGGRNG